MIRIVPDGMDNPYAIFPLRYWLYQVRDWLAFYLCWTQCQPQNLEKVSKTAMGPGNKHGWDLQTPELGQGLGAEFSAPIYDAAF